MSRSIHTEQPIKNLVLPAEHLRLRLIAAVITFLFGCRGSFKTTRAQPLYALDNIYKMPRSSGGIIGLSFEHMGDNTIPPFLQAMEEFGFHSGEHYIYGKRPPASWPKPYNGIYNDKYDHVISWHNGTAIHIVSLMKKASANGLSLQWGIFDEVKFMDQKQLLEEIFPIFRGNEEYFKYCAGYLSKMFTTDKEADPVQIKWLLDHRSLVDPVLIDIIMTYALEINELMFEVMQENISETKKAKLQRQIDVLDEELSLLRSKAVYVGEISADDVRPIYGDRWYKDKRMNSSDRVWKVSYKNEDPTTAGDTFYPKYNKELHEYERLDDINSSKPFIIAPDYQHSVAPIPIAQLTRLPGSDEITLNYVDEVYTLAQPNTKDIQPNGNGSKGFLQEAVQLFCDRYANHGNKTVYYVYDATAKGKRVNVDEYYKIVRSILKKNKWKVVLVYTGKPPDHYKKHTNTSDWLDHTDGSLPRILINRLRCKKMITSITGAPAKTTNGKTEKDKEYENTNKYPNVNQAETTHFSDAFDMINHAVLFLRKIKTVLSRKGTAMRG